MVEERFRSRLIVGPSGCWEWQLGRDRSGYGRLRQGDRLVLAHRYAWSVWRGDIPEGFDVCHKCDNPPCCNPDHLFLGTHLENMRDCAGKGRRVGKRGVDSPNHKITEAEVVEIRRLRGDGWTLRRIGDQFGIHLSSVSLIARGKAWGHVSGV